MSKNSKSKPGVTLTTLDATEQKLRDQLANIAKKREDLKKAEGNRIAGIVESFKEQLGVNSYAEVISTIKAVEKGTLGSIAASTGRPYTVLTAEQKAGAIERLKVGGPGNQVSEIAKDLKVSEGSIWALKSKAGLTKKRNAEPAPVTEPAQTEAPPATEPSVTTEPAPASAS